LIPAREIFNKEEGMKKKPIVFLLIIVVLLIPLACISGSETHKITYAVGGLGRADLTYENASGGTEQRTVTIPWSMTFSAPSGQFVYLSAQLDGSGSLYCEIVSDGTIVQQANSSGEYVIASCSGRVP
jgi:hypothetical protein